MTKKDWIKAQADHRSGLSFAKICAKYGVSMADLLKRIKAEGWERGNKKKTAVSTQVNPQTEEINSKVDEALDEAVAEIIQSHRGISRQLRAEIDSEISEYQELKLFFVSALDKNTINELIRQGEPGKPNPLLIEHLNNCLIAFGKRINISDKLVRLASLLIDTERKVWALDKESEGPEHETYDDLLEYIKKPLPARSLPEGVIDFEEKIAQRREN